MRRLIGVALFFFSTAAVPGNGLLWHVETPGGETTASHRADEAINPASIVKVATTLWALETLGPEHRFTTRFGFGGSIDETTGVLDGNLVVRGGGDPDFHVENAYLVARALAQAGLREVGGSLLVDDLFWIGWERGAHPDSPRRSTEMARRLRDALDSTRWNAPTRRATDEFRARRGLQDEPPPAIPVRGEASRDTVGGDLPLKLAHRSNPLHKTLKRLNAYSNNDIERLGAGLGSAEELSEFLARRWGAAEASPRFETHSGLGVNRMSCRQIVRLLRDLQETCERLELEVDAVLPVAGCDPGTLEKFPRLAGAGLAGSVTGKTGTLTATDGGIAVLAGYAQTRNGTRLFCVASPRIGRAVRDAREAQERWLIEMIDGEAGPAPRECGPGVVYSDDEAVVEISASCRAR